MIDTTKDLAPPYTDTPPWNLSTFLRALLEVSTFGLAALSYIIALALTL